MRVTCGMFQRCQRKNIRAASKIWRNPIAPRLCRFKPVGCACQNSCIYESMKAVRFSGVLLALIASCVTTMVGIGNAQTQPEGQPIVQVQMQNVMYHFTERIAVHIFNLRGNLVPTKANSISVFDDNRSFLLAIDSAEISISTSAMANVLNDHVFAASDAPLKGIIITAEGKGLKI